MKGATTRWAVFLDVDGTLVNDRGVVPASARDAVHRARANGHLVFLCTGRSVSELWPEILEIGFDGVVAAAGGYVEVDGAVLSHRPLPIEALRRAVEFLDGRGVEYLLESNDGLHGSSGVQAELRRLLLGQITDEDVLAELERGLGGFIDSVVVGADPLMVPVNKIVFLDSDVTLDEYRAELGEVLDVTPAAVPMFGANSGELTQPGVHKAAGIEVITEHLGIARSDTLALGDGFNDLEMLRHVAVGIAMGNAPQPVRDAADHVTGTPDEGGVHSALSRFGLI